MPVAILIVVALAAMAVDAAAAYLGQRRLSDLAAGLAVDAVAAIDEESFYTEGSIEVVPSRVLQRRDAVVAALVEDRAFADVRCDVIDINGAEVTVTCQARARPIFGVALPGGSAVFELRAVESARSAAP